MQVAGSRIQEPSSRMLDLSTTGLRSRKALVVTTPNYKVIEPKKYNQSKRHQNESDEVEISFRNC